MANIPAIPTKWSSELLSPECNFFREKSIRHLPRFKIIQVINTPAMTRGIIRNTVAQGYSNKSHS